MDKKIFAILMILILTMSMPALAYDQNSPASYSVSIVVQTASTFTVTLPTGETSLRFTGKQGDTNVNATGQNNTKPWAKINNTGIDARNFTVGLNLDPPTGITINASNTSDMAVKIPLNKTIRELPGGSLLTPLSILTVWIKADYNALAPIGTYTNNVVIRNYMPVLQSITVTGPICVLPNTNRVYTATGTDQEGNSMPVSPSWTASPLGTIDASGTFSSGTTTGSTTINATSGAIVGSLLISIDTYC